MVQLFIKYVASFLYISTEASAGPEHPCVMGEQSLQLPILLSRKGAATPDGVCAQICLAVVGEMV